MEYSIDLVRKRICSLGQALVSLEKELTELDSKLGDGDLGLSMARGGEALCRILRLSGLMRGRHSLGVSASPGFARIRRLLFDGSVSLRWKFAERVLGR